MDPDEEEFGEAMQIASETTEAEREYEKVLEQLREMEGMKFYADVYTKLYDSYFNLKEENLTQTQEINTLKTKISRFDDVVGDYIQDIADNQKTIERLRAEIDEAQALADAMHTRELASVESLETIKKLVAKLEKELEARRRAGDEDAGATSAVKEKEKFEKEKAKLKGELDLLKQKVVHTTAYNDELQKKVAQNDDIIIKLEESLEEAENNAVRTNRLIDHLKSESESLKIALEQQKSYVANADAKAEKDAAEMERRDRQIANLNKKTEAAVEEQEAAVAKAKMFRTKMEKMQDEFNQMKLTVLNNAKELKALLDDNSKQRNDVTKLTKNLSTMTKKIQQVELKKLEVESERDGLRNQITVMEHDLSSGKKQAENDKREIENLNREKEVLNKNMQKVQGEALANLEMIHMQEQRRKKLEHELDQNVTQTNKQRLIIRQLEKDKDRMLEETIALNEKIDEIAEEVRLRVADIVDLKKMLHEETVKSRKLSVALDECRAERNMLHKNCTEALDEIQDLKQKLKMLAYQIEQLKEDIGGKEAGLKSCESMLSKSQKKCEMLRSEIQNGVTKLAEARADISALRQEEARLNRIVQEGDASRAKMLKELEGLMNERDVIGAQLVRRNDEISLLYEKIRILEITLQRGERQYELRVDDIRLLRLEIIRLRKEKNLLSKGIENMTDLRLEVLQTKTPRKRVPNFTSGEKALLAQIIKRKPILASKLTDGKSVAKKQAAWEAVTQEFNCRANVHKVFNLERELGRERLRVRALEEALETPLNVHRWRKLQGTDPESVRLTQKLRLTQKKVLAQSEMLVLKDRELKETRNLYNAVKEMLALQPSPEIQTTLVRTQRTLTQRTTKMKCLIAELSMREQLVTDLRLELDKSNADLVSFKQKYYEMKRALDADEARMLKVPVCSPTCEK